MGIGLVVPRLAGVAFHAAVLVGVATSLADTAGASTLGRLVKAVSAQQARCLCLQWLITTSGTLLARRLSPSGDITVGTGAARCADRVALSRATITDRAVAAVGLALRALETTRIATDADSLTESGVELARLAEDASGSVFVLAVGTVAAVHTTRAAFQRLDGALNAGRALHRAVESGVITAETVHARDLTLVDTEFTELAQVAHAAALVLLVGTGRAVVAPTGTGGVGVGTRTAVEARRARLQRGESTLQTGAAGGTATQRLELAGFARQAVDSAIQRRVRTCQARGAVGLSRSGGMCTRSAVDAGSHTNEIGCSTGIALFTRGQSVLITEATGATQRAPGLPGSGTVLAEVARQTAFLTVLRLIPAASTREAVDKTSVVGEGTARAGQALSLTGGILVLPDGARIACALAFKHLRCTRVTGTAGRTALEIRGITGRAESAHGGTRLVTESAVRTGGAVHHARHALILTHFTSEAERSTRLIGESTGLAGKTCRLTSDNRVEAASALVAKTFTTEGLELADFATSARGATVDGGVSTRAAQRARTLTSSTSCRTEAAGSAHGATGNRLRGTQGAGIAVAKTRGVRVATRLTTHARGLTVGRGERSTLAGGTDGRSGKGLIATGSTKRAAAASDRRSKLAGRAIKADGLSRLRRGSTTSTRQAGISIRLGLVATGGTSTAARKTRGVGERSRLADGTQRLAREVGGLTKSAGETLRRALLVLVLAGQAVGAERATIDACGSTSRTQGARDTTIQSGKGADRTRQAGLLAGDRLV